jgi:hypothetical protein
MKNSSDTIGNEPRDLPYRTVIPTQPRRPQPRTAHFAHSCSGLATVVHGHMTNLNYCGRHSAFHTLNRILISPCLGSSLVSDVSGQPTGPIVNDSQHPRSQKSKDLIYTAAAAWNSLRFFWFVICAQLSTIDKVTSLSGKKKEPSHYVQINCNRKSLNLKMN